MRYNFIGNAYKLYDFTNEYLNTFTHIFVINKVNFYFFSIIVSLLLATVDYMAKRDVYCLSDVVSSCFSV